MRIEHLRSLYIYIMIVIVHHTLYIYIIHMVISTHTFDPESFHRTESTRDESERARVWLNYTQHNVNLIPVSAAVRSSWLVRRFHHSMLFNIIIDWFSACRGKWRTAESARIMLSVVGRATTESRLPYITLLVLFDSDGRGGRLMIFRTSRMSMSCRTKKSNRPHT